MAGANFTKLIEFKVKGTELTRAVDKIFKGINKIEVKVKETNKGLKIVVKNFNDVEKEIKKVNRETINWGRNLQKAAKDSTKLSNGILGLLKKVGVGTGKGGVFGFSKLTGELGLFDAGLRKISGKGLPYFTKRVLEAGGAVGAFGLAHAGAIAAISTGAIVLGKGTRFFFDLGKAARQAEASVQDFIATTKKLGLKGGIGSLFPAGSHLGGLKGKQATPSSGPSSPIGQYSSRGLEQVKARAIESQYAGLTKINRELNRNREIQENINAFSLGHARATREIAKSQVFYNVELAKTRAVQALVTADIFAAQRAWSGLVGIVKGATGILGGLLGGKAGKLGQAAGIIGVSAAIKDLVQKIPFISQAWKDSIQAHALWVQRITEGLTAVTLAHTAFSKVIGAARWTGGAIDGFVKWEKAAFDTFHRINKGRIDLDRKMAARLDKGENMFTGIGRWLGGGDKRIEEKEAIYREPTREIKITKELEKQKQLLAQHNASSSEYTTIREKILKLEELQTKELNTRKRADVRGGADPEKVFADEFKAMEDALENFESTQKKIKDRAASQEDARIKRRIAEDDKANKIAMAAKQKIWDADTAAWDLRMKQKDKERMAEKRYQDQLRKRKDARKEKMSRLGENLMLGAGFPLLFGGGAGAVGGGVLGAGLQAMSGSQGFGMQILFSALGQQLDAFAGKTAELGQAFIALDKDASTLIESLGVKGTEYERQINQLKKLGAEEEAFALARDKMLKLVGQDGVNNLTRFGQETQDLGNEWGKLVTQMQAGLAGLITASGALRALVDGINRQVVINQAIANVGGDQKLTDINAAIARYSSGEIRPGGLAGGSGPQAGKNVFKDFPSMKELNQQLFERQTYLNQKGADQDLEALKAAKQEAVLKTLQEEEKLILNKIKYGEKEAAIKQKIAEIMKDNKDLDEKKVENAVRAIAAAEKELDQAQQLNELYKQVGQTIENGIVSAIENAITGARTLGEALRDIVQSVGRQFLNAAISAGVGAITSSWGNNMGGRYGGQSGPLSSSPPPLPPIPNAEGGFYTGPTNALVAEAGESEYIIPESKMGDALAKYAGGARGDDVLAGGGEIGGEGGAGGASSGVIDVTFNTQVINDVSYVTYAEFQAGVQQAAAEGAKRGEQATLRRLQTSPSTRRRVGV